MRRLDSILFVSMILTGLSPAAAAPPACIPELTVSRKPAEVHNTTLSVELQVRGTWTCGGEVPVLRDVTVEGRTIRVVLEAEVQNGTVLREEPFAVTTDLGALEPGENRVEVYFDQASDEEPPALMSVRPFEVAFTSLGPATFSVSPVGPRSGDVVTVGVEGTWSGGAIELAGVERTGRRIRLLATAAPSGSETPVDYALTQEIGPLASGTYVLELAIDVAEVPGERFQVAASDSFEVRSLCEDLPSIGADSNEAGATLLVPYFEVDLENPEGANTQITIGNADRRRPALVNVVLWTDWGVPSYSFTLYLAKGSLQPLDLRGLFEGRVPASGPGTGLSNEAPGCRDPLAVPAVDVPRLRAMHTGVALPGSGLCAGSPREDAHVAVGYVTADVVRSCSDTVRVPGDVGYFAADGSGRAGLRNILWGDVLYLRPGDDSAQGINAVSIPAAPGRKGDTFYGLLLAENGSDARLPLPKSHRLRFLSGGDLQMATSFLVWSGGIGRYEPSVCGRPREPLELAASIRNQRGQLLEELAIPSQALAARLEVGPVPFDTSLRAGQIDVGMRTNPPISVSVQLQTWVVPVLAADGRYSVAYEATPLDAVCRRRPHR